MLRLCELYAVGHNIIFKAKKSQLLYFGSNPSNDPCTVDLIMLNGQAIQFVKKCIHLGNELCPMSKHMLIDNAVNDLNCRLNNLLADFAHCSGIISTLSALFRCLCRHTRLCSLSIIILLLCINSKWITLKILLEYGASTRTIVIWFANMKLWYYQTCLSVKLYSKFVTAPNC